MDWMQSQIVCDAACGFNQPPDVVFANKKACRKDRPGDGGFKPNPHKALDPVLFRTKHPSQGESCESLHNAICDAKLD